MTEPREDLEAFHALAAQQRSWVSSAAKRLQEEDAQRRLDALAVERIAREEAEIAELRRREQRAVELGEAERSRWLWPRGRRRDR
jgi:hypothetical protein